MFCTRVGSAVTFFSDILEETSVIAECVDLEDCCCLTVDARCSAGRRDSRYAIAAKQVSKRCSVAKTPAGTFITIGRELWACTVRKSLIAFGMEIAPLQRRG